MGRPNAMLTNTLVVLPECMTQYATVSNLKGYGGLSPKNSLKFLRNSHINNSNQYLNIRFNFNAQPQSYVGRTVEFLISNSRLSRTVEFLISNS